MEYSCSLSGLLMHCTITPTTDLKGAVFCFSGMAPMFAKSGGTRITSTGSYTEIALPDLLKNTPHVVTIAFDGGFTPANRAWMPLGPHLRIGRDVIELPPTEAGMRARPAPNFLPFDGLRIIPQPTDFSPSGGTLLARFFATTDDVFQSVNALALRRKMGAFLHEEGIPIVFQQDDLPRDGYRLAITPDKITVYAADDGGKFYAGITLLTLLHTHNGALPCGEISDTPRFDWRGQHLDTARHFYQPQTIHDLLDLMALLKLNRFHWHFADDEAFRLQIDCLPELWQQTEFCGENELLPALFSGKTHSGGSYSKNDARAIIAHAAALNIEVMPEIEAPAHALAIARVFPDVRDPSDNGAETSVQGYRGNALNPAMPKTWDILNAIVAEVGALFPFKYIHLGCDELPTDTWMGSPKARALMQENALETTDDLQGWMMEKLAQTVVQNGQRPAAWEEAAKGNNGGIGHNAILFSWSGQGPGIEAAHAGYDVVMTPAQNVYLDMAHTSDPDDWGASWAAFIALEDTINWEPVPTPSLEEKIIGVQGTFWSEFTTEDSQIWPMLMPRILGVASKAWQRTDLTKDDLEQLAGHYLSLNLGYTSS